MAHVYFNTLSHLCYITTHFLLNIIAVCQFVIILACAGTASRYAFFGQGRGPILLEYVRCSGFDETLLGCANNGLGYSTCGHYEDAGVICEG